MPLAKFQFKAGIDKEGTSYTNAGGWFDASLVRFRKGFVEKIGGWTKQSATAFVGTCRNLFAWISLGGSKYLFVGTNLKAYVLEGTTLSDITPIRATTTNGIVFAATNGSAVITATDSSHGATVNDFVTISGAASLGGAITAAVLNQEYQVVSVPSANTFTFTATATANGSDTGNGGSGADAAYQLSAGLDVYLQSTGFGSGRWGDGGYGSSTSLSFTNQLRLWSSDNFGEDLILHPRGGGVFYWDESGGTTTRAVDITTLSGANLSPTVGLQTIVSDTDRHVIVLGADPVVGGARTGTLDPMFVAFSDQESITEWEPKTDNTAGSIRLSSGSEIRGGIRSRQETLIWTDTALYSMQFVGPPLTFSVNLINEGVGMIGPNACTNSPNGIFWMSDDGFYLYNGSVKKLPCSVLSYIQEDLNLGQAFKVFGLLNSEYNEVWWFYPADSDGTEEVSRYVIYNYEEGSWSIGQLVRTAWVEEGVFQKPLATTNNFIYNQEDGDDDDGLPMDGVFIESADFDLQDGNSFAFIRRMIPDIKFYGTNVESGVPQINMLLKTRNAPSESLTTRATKDISNNTDQVHVRARGRQAVLRLQSDDDAATGVRLGYKWRLGYTRLDISPDGRR
tara:strand:- start:386 stop:2248 length:1863 start_codon:yes stop_codon:yes gene_type:complete